MFRRFSRRLPKSMDLLVYSSDIQNLTEIVKNRLYFGVVADEVTLKNTADTLFFNTDEEYCYINYYYDFGPLNLSCLYKYCCKLNDLLHCSDYKRVVHYTWTNPQDKANAAFLIGAFAVIYLRVPPREITRALVAGCVHFMPFADASQGGSEWKITLIDCFTAVYKASTFGFFNFNDFNALEYDINDKLQNGDMNWILPRKFLAFIGPTDMDIPNYHSPEFYLQYFVHNDVKVVIRLNNATYNPSVFTSVGIDHYDLFFPDGTTPPKHILLEFLHLCEQTSGAIAVHCKAGLGRTGTLIAAYIIKHYRMTAREAIAWLRICRPGSVIGQQQGYLEQMESWLWRQGNHFRLEHYGSIDRIPHHTYGVYSYQWIKERTKWAQAARMKELQSSTSSSTANQPVVKKQLKSEAPEQHRCSHKNGMKTSDNVRVNPNYFGYNNGYNNQMQDSRPGTRSKEKDDTQGDKLNSIKLQRKAGQGSPLSERSSHGFTRLSNLNVHRQTASAPYRKLKNDGHKKK